MGSSCSEVQIWSQNRFAEAAYNQQDGENRMLIHDSIVTDESR